MMVEQIVLTTILLGWLFYRFAIRDEERQSLQDLANRQGVELSHERAVRAAAAGTTARMRERLVAQGSHASKTTPATSATDRLVTSTFSESGRAGHRRASIAVTRRAADSVRNC
jgi:hypothetical protein